ncbi:hypothetical protein [Bradyrhizobium sp. BRP56]|uniref:hypothetical protein n=1 Tax=Bradyrhizobium sp. BRP56 TaxID=2793819 RepID=UPI001CD3B760|nr:hypothetical protein [Bradyrhizobium sp. BRP56]MCA1400046.1 hypothetical protein [Bradyrhizobium sp. BRP56]
MPRQSNGTYQQPANTSGIPSTPISSTAYNALITDIGSEITNSLDRGGRSAMTAPLPMGGQKITGMADPTVSTDGATKNYVDTKTAAFFSTGDVKLTLKAFADPGWVLVVSTGDGSGLVGTIGSAASGAVLRANADCQALFTLLYTVISDANSPLFTSSGVLTTRAAQGTAATAWAANCRIHLGFWAGRAIGVTGNSGSGFTARVPLAFVGEETHVLSASEIPSISSGGSYSGSATVNSVNWVASNPNDSTAVSVVGGGVGLAVSAASGGTVSKIQSIGSSSGSVALTSTNTGGTAHNNMQPSIFVNAMVKL